ncbi:LacI family DNA-binding transcriptional regulator [Lacticaseibacillus absianus]|uniref:LacI family DNA-binding transcriptional regulator n=1 Tax=Lacticaseibacillus absianus TaxID=2729623 RepID=UPI0015CC88F1|nr:LacI family DNA-binding transcriptional regulator [Lacticaseibacillus absianus]
MAVKIYQVAAEAGVSVGTVSRVFNHYPDVSEETRRRVLATAKHLGYVPNVAARTLSSKSLATVALILNEVARGFEGTLAMHLMQGVNRYTQKHGIEFVLYMTDAELQREKTFEQFCLERNITGAIVHGLNVGDPFISQIQASKIPVVCIEQEILGANTASIGIDNRAAELEVTSDMLRQGRRNLVMINGWRTAAVSQQRQQGFLEALAQADRPILDYTVQFAGFDLDNAMALTNRLIVQHPTIDGFICASDIMAVGVLKALRQHGIAVPTQVAVAGFDNTVVGRYMEPSLSTVEQHMEAMGGRAAKLMHDLIGHKLPQDYTKRNVFVPYEYIQRRSTDFGRDREG